MDVVSMLKSRDAFVPCRNLSFGNRLSLTAVQKAFAFPLQAGFMPNSPMPMLDICDWLPLTTVSTTCGGMVVSLLGCPAIFPPWLPVLVTTMMLLVRFCLRYMVVGVEKLCCVFLCRCWPASNKKFRCFELVCVVYNCTYFISGARRPDSIRISSLVDVQTCKWFAQ